MDKKEIKQENTKKKEKTKLNIWMVGTIVFTLLFIISLFFRGGTGGIITGNVISSQEAGGKVLGLINDYFIEDGYAILRGIEEESGLYKVNLLYQGQVTAIYMTKDGSYLIMPNGIMDVAQLEATANQQQAQQTEQQNQGYSEEDLEKISTFIDCLAEKGVKIYGANWCGWTERFVVETLGGFEVAAPIYIECTENQELCSQEGVSGYPTTKINGELYTGARTFEGLSEATGCPAPEVGVVQSSSGEASCS